MQIATKINLRELLSACISLSHCASHEIRRIYNRSQAFNVFEKGDPTLAKNGKYDDPTTEADVRSQKIITTSLYNLFPTLRIIAEEEENTFTTADQTSQQPQMVFPNLSFVPQDLISDSVLLDDSALIVWVDPLDGTSGFVRKNTEIVTVLIGISYNKIPIAGVITKPFSIDPVQKTPLVVWGANLGSLGLDSFVRTESSTFVFRKIQKEDFSQSRRDVIISESHSDTPGYHEFVRKVNPGRVVKEGGCGNKMLTLLRENFAAYIFPQPGTKKWDTCAPQAILEAAGGVMTEPDGEKIVYGVEDIENRKGFVATLGTDHDTFVLRNI